MNLCNYLVNFTVPTHQLIAQFQGIPLQKSQPYVRTFRGRAAPPKRTFEGVSAPSKPTFSLILHHLALHPHPRIKRMQKTAVRFHGACAS